METVLSEMTCSTSFMILIMLLHETENRNFTEMNQEIYIKDLYKNSHTNTQVQLE